MILPVVPPPAPSDIETRIEALNLRIKDIDADLQIAFNRIVELDALVTAKSAGIAAPFKVATRTPARCITGYNATGKPLFEIYPKDTSETKDRIYLDGVVQVFPYPMTGDGGRKAYPVYRQAPKQLYVYSDDGELQA
jgi:hypothetical protein